METRVRRNAARFGRRAYLCLALAGLSAYTLHALGGVGWQGSTRVFDVWLTDAMLVLAVVALVVRVVFVRAERAVWSARRRALSRLLPGLLRRARPALSLAHLARRTRLRNRRGLMVDLERATGARDPAPHVFALLDLNGFKQYNDTFGHPAGDALLTRLGHRLSETIGRHGTAYRLGGDEFCILCSPTDDTDLLVRRAVEALTEQGSPRSERSSAPHTSAGTAAATRTG